jgi:Uma2 family endonuclease
MSDPTRETFTTKEYLVLEQTSPTRHEFVGGFLYAMAGGSSQHARISLNIAANFLGLSKGKNCRVYQEAMKFQYRHDVYYHPDVMVVCDKTTPDKFFENQPCVLVEVLSPSTRGSDLREKQIAYTATSSLQTYLIVESEKRVVIRHYRDELGEWQFENLKGDGEINLPCLSATLNLTEIYEGIL